METKELQAREQIERLIFTYALALDAGDLQTVSALFARGRIAVDGQSEVMDGAEAVKETLARFTCFYDVSGNLVDPLEQSGVPHTRHITSNLMFESLTADQAIVHSVFTVIQGMPGEEIKMVISGRYRDTFACEQGDDGLGGSWFFKERYEYIDLIGDISRHLRMNPF